MLVNASTWHWDAVIFILFSYLNVNLATNATDVQCHYGSISTESIQRPHHTCSLAQTLMEQLNQADKHA